MQKCKKTNLQIRAGLGADERLDVVISTVVIPGNKKIKTKFMHAELDFEPENMKMLLILIVLVTILNVKQILRFSVNFESSTRGVNRYYLSPWSPIERTQHELPSRDLMIKILSFD